LNNKTFASSSGDRSLRIWDIESGECLNVFNLFKYTIYANMFHMIKNTGDDLIVVTGANEVKIIDLIKQEIVNTIKLSNQVYRMVYSKYSEVCNYLGFSIQTQWISVWDI
jgi:WD40 repeat protein